jgi:hypothetical protein
MKSHLVTILGAIAIAACGPKAKSSTPTPITAGDADDDQPAGESMAGHDHADHPDGHQAPGPDVAPPPSEPDPAQVKADLLAAETKAYEAAKPVFDKYCASCHQQGGKKATAKKLGHFDITRYPFGGHHAGEVGKTVRDVLGVGGGKPTMPYGNPGSVKGDELALIVAWSEAFDASHAGGAHEGMPGHDHGH